MASALLQLSDADLDAVCNLIRRDAHTDAQIAEEAARRLGGPISESEAGAVNVIYRFRNSARYQQWLARWHRERSELEGQLAQQRNRFELISEVLSAGDGTGIEKVSSALQARALALAAEASEDDFVEGLKGRGWVASAMKLAQATVRDTYRKRAEALKDELRRLMAGDGDAAPPLGMDAVVSAVDAIMGIR